MAEKEWNPANLLDVFGDRIARATLVLANRHTVSVADMAERLDVSDQTIYRRVDELVAHDLLTEHRRLGQNGNQYTEYETAVDEVTFAIDDTGYTLDVQFRQGLTDDFESLLSDMGQADPGADTDQSPHPGGATDHST